MDAAAAAPGTVAVAAVDRRLRAGRVAQYFVGELFFNPELGDANELHVYFRVNSIFCDPNIFGRYLALAIRALAACIAWGGERRELAAAAARRSRVGLVGARLHLLADQLRRPARRPRLVALLRWRWRGAAAFAALGVVALAALVVAGGTPTSDIEDVRSIDSGHTDLARGGLILFGVLEPEPPPADQDVGKPIAGYGSGSFGRAFFEHIEQARTTVSHSEPVTVAAEQGVIGLGALRRAAGRRVAGRPARRRRPAARWRARAVAACFVALLVHSFGYTGFAIDPVDVGAARARRRACAANRARAAARTITADARLPAPPGDHGRRLHGLERALEADRGLPAADLHRRT